MAAVTLACSRDNGSQVLRLENFDIENGPDLRLYLVPGAGKADPTDDSLQSRRAARERR
jgi:hypothetical protein